MDYKDTLTTERLVLKVLDKTHADFIHSLVNSDGWIQFIGDRNIHSTQDAIEYIQRINDNPNVLYWAVELRDTDVAIGIITLIKRDYLEHEDIGFAFLPSSFNQGYAYEAVSAVLDNLLKHEVISKIYAVTIVENVPSIKLIEKLGLKFQKEIEQDDKLVQIYHASKDELVLFQKVVAK